VQPSAAGIRGSSRGACIPLPPSRLAPRRHGAHSSPRRHAAQPDRARNRDSQLTDDRKFFIC
jgi:hypothetical protein